MIKFSILVPTYNRHELVVYTLKSLYEQTYTNFEVLLFDNGSTPSVKTIAQEFCDPRLKFLRYEKNEHICDLGEEALKQITGSHFLFLADDDALVPTALEIAANILEDNDSVKVLSAGILQFNHSTRVYNSEDTSKLFTGKLEVFDGEEVTLFHCNNWGIGASRNYKAPRTEQVHASAIFISTQLIWETCKLQRELFVKPFGDVGYIGTYLYIEHLYHLDLPLGIIGDSPVRETNGARPGQRQKWNREVEHLEHTPIKGASFTNMAADVHLKVMYRNGLNKKYDCRLRPDFYERHLRQVLSDSPWTEQTWKDIAECCPYWLGSWFSFISLKEILLNLVKLPIFIFVKTYRLSIKVRKKILSQFTISEKHTESSVQKFEDINEFSRWADNKYIKLLWKPSTYQLKKQDERS